MRRTSFILGLLVLMGVWLTDLPLLARSAFWAHMAMHMGVVAVASPLLAFGIAGGRLDPVRIAPKFFAPVQASIVELLVVWVWHAPVLHHAARHHLFGVLVEQSAFLLSGLFVWLSAVGGKDARDSPRRAAGVLGLLLTSMHMTLLGALLALTPRPLFHQPAGTDGITALEDQHLGGAIMLLVGGIAYLAGGLGLTIGLVRGRTRTIEKRA